MPPTTETEMRELRELVLGLREEMRLGFANSNTQFTVLNSELKTELKRVEDELKNEVKRVEIDLKNEVKRVEIDLKAEVKRVEIDLKAEVKRVEIDLKTEIKRVEGDLKTEIKRVEGDLKTDVKQVEFALSNEFQKSDATSQQQLTALQGSINVLEERTKLGFWGFIWRSVIIAILALLVGFAIRYILFGSLRI